MLIPEECGQGISCEEVCKKNDSSERESAVIMDDNGDSDQDAQDICTQMRHSTKYYGRFEEDPSFFKKLYLANVIKI